MIHKGPPPLVMCGPSGSGKSTLLKKLLKDYPDSFGFSVSHTTRAPRPGETDGVHYHFTNKEEMEAAIERGEFIETAMFSGNMYGTSKRSVEEVRSTGKICILDIEIEGMKQVKATAMEPLFVFIMPPSLEELERRLRARNTEDEESIKRRLEIARKEIEFGQDPGNFQVVIVNDNLQKAYSQLIYFIAKNVKMDDSGKYGTDILNKNFILKIPLETQYYVSSPLGPPHGKANH